MHRASFISRIVKTRVRFLSISFASSRPLTMGSEIGRLPRKFAPLNPDIQPTDETPKLAGIVFDVDGTLWYADPWDLSTVIEYQALL